MKKSYSLIGVDGNAFAIMGYVAKALKEVGLGDVTNQYVEEATMGDYNNLIVVSAKYIDKANEWMEK